MRVRVLLLVGLLASWFFAHSQTGNYFLSHYAPTDERIDHITYAMAQTDRGVIYFANKSGVLEFDGRNWSLIETPGPVYSLSTLGEEVYVGGSFGFGKLAWGVENTRTYESLSDDQPDATRIISCLPQKDKVYFLNEQELFVFSITTGKTESAIKADTQQSAFETLFEIVGNIYVGTETTGLLKIDQGKLVSSNFALPNHLKVLFCSTMKGSSKVLIGADSSRVFVFDADKGIREIPIEDRSYLDHNVLVSGTWVSDSLVALGTLRRGVMFVEPRKGKSREFINYYTGLPDNEVYCMLTDRNQGLWVAHDYGFTRVAPFLPFRSYSHYPGLVGNLLCAYGYKGQLYVGTTLGLYVLVKEELYEDEPIYIALDKGRSVPDEPKKKGIFSFLKKDKEKDKKKPAVGGNKPAPAPPKPKKRLLKSVQYGYKKVEGADGKISQLVVAHDKLLAGGVAGVVEVNGEKSTYVMHEPVRSVYMSPSINQLLVSTFHQEVKSFSLDKKAGWTETHSFDTLRENVNYIFEDKLQNIWMCTQRNIIKVEVVDSVISDLSIVPLENPSLDEPVGVAWGSEVYVAASGFFNKYDVTKNEFARFKNNKLPGAKKYFASAGYFWFYDGRRWRNVDENVQKALKLEWLGLFQNIRYLTPTSNGDGMWVITGANELYNFSINQVTNEQARYPLFLREVRGKQNKIAPAKSLKINQLESSVSFEFIQPDFLGMKSTEYKFRVVGLNKDWSDWSVTNNIVNFSYLPTGKYVVEVQTRDLMSTQETEQIDQVDQIELEVEPPYWKRSWFYAMEFTFFSLLVFISIRLSSGNPRYRYLSRLLSVLTVIMLIQFIQTIVASQISFTSTPVIDFFIQVFIALLVLPIEGYLRKFMLKTADAAAVPARLWDEEKNVSTRDVNDE